VQNPQIDTAPAPPLWAGIECTVNRVGDSYFDQICLTGHEGRIEDLDRLAALGVRALRYPVLWERTAPQENQPIDWSWPDARLTRLRALGVRPIVGLLHHGSGPRHTHLLDPDFPHKLAAYAGQVARRYPFVTDWTPVNETVTTARFAALYGMWFPHRRDERSFARVVLNQCRGIVLAMQAVRAVNPTARLIHTEDAGRIIATPPLQYQADYENNRQRLALDLLFGRVVPGHPLWRNLLWLGATERELLWFLEQQCPPNVVGLNYYLTSDRYLDHRIGGYPAHVVGGNGRHSYADVEAVRVGDVGLVGHEETLQSTWDRYRAPVAFTEVHVGCSPAEQFRWFAEAWSASVRARARGVAVEGVTAWSVLGSFDWDKLVTRIEGRYEPGLYDVQGDTPALTPLGRFVRRVGRGGALEHAALRSPGWWRHTKRILYDPGVASEMPGARPLVKGATHGEATRSRTEGDAAAAS
jgi:dTDP-4-dehydrorhamnose reductase